MPQCQPTTVATQLKIESVAPKANPLEPELKGLIDRVLCPNLVKRFVVEKLQNQKSDDRGSKS
jgi:hypothetical protein